MTIDPAIRTQLRERPYWYLSLIIAFALISAVVADIDIPALPVLLALPLMPFALFAVFKGMSGQKTYGSLFAIIIMFVLAANFRTRSYADKDIDFQVALKLCAIGALFVLSLLSIRRIFEGIHIYGLLSWLSFLVYMLATCAYTINPMPAVVAVISLFGGFLFVCYLCVHFGRASAISIVVTAGAILWVGSLAVYFALPSLGRMSDWIGGDFVETWRLQGLLGSSNAAGMSGALGLFLVMAFYARQPGHSRLLASVAALSALACMVLSNNRMAMFAIMTSTGMLYVMNRGFAHRVLFLSAMALLGTSLVVLFADQLLALVSRSGSWDEIMSATGRTRIWSVVIDLWSQTPMMGRGFGSALYILPIHPDLFRAAAHAHSLYLEQLFSGGLIGLGLFLCSIVITFVVAWRTRAARECSLMVFFLIYGLTEPVISGPVSFPLIIMFLAAVLILQNARPRPLFVGSDRITPLRAGAVWVLAGERTQ
jgi:O-antigen ligase